MRIQNLNAAGLTLVADQQQEASAREDIKLRRELKASAADRAGKAAEHRLTKAKEAADAELSANETKADGAMWGSFIGIGIAMASIAVCGAFPPAIPIVAAAALGGGTMVGGAFAGWLAKGDERTARAARTESERAEVTEKNLEKLGDDLREQIKGHAQVRDQVLADARKRRDARAELRTT